MLLMLISDLDELDVVSSETLTNTNLGLLPCSYSERSMPDDKFLVRICVQRSLRYLLVH